ncbi:hypothetical protein HG530_008258 [Fusarium avenaceum]|nr:hypothetical protein HG530_008258 [Fusarium avenaceum]
MNIVHSTRHKRHNKAIRLYCNLLIQFPLFGQGPGAAWRSQILPQPYHPLRPNRNPGTRVCTTSNAVGDTQARDRPVATPYQTRRHDDALFRGECADAAIRRPEEGIAVD